MLPAQLARFVEGRREPLAQILQVEWFSKWARWLALPEDVRSGAVQVASNPWHAHRPTHAWLPTCGLAPI